MADHPPCWRRRDAGVALGALLAAPLAHPAVPGAPPGVRERELVIGQSITLEGHLNPYGRTVLSGMQLALADANRAGGVFGRRLTLRTLDDGNDNARAAENARRLAGEDVFCLFGAVEGGPSTAVAGVAAQRQVPFFGPLAGSPGLRRPYQAMVFPVRAEHRDEFAALLAYGHSIGLRSVAFFHADSAVGREHLGNVRALSESLGLQIVLPLPFKSGIGDAELDAMAAEIARVRPGLCLNHGSPALYGRLTGRVRTARLRTEMLAVNSGSTEMARQLGPLAHGMVFSQVVPSPWERKYAISRDYQAAARATRPDGDLSYAELEGYLTARALVLALHAAGPRPTRERFVSALHEGSFDVGGVRLRYAPGAHDGSRFVDLALYGREGRFVH